MNYVGRLTYLGSPDVNEEEFLERLGDCIQYSKSQGAFTCMGVIINSVGALY